VLGARWDEFDFAAKLWAVPADRMKAEREHRVPLCDRALAIVAMLAKARTGSFVFPGQRPDRPLSARALAMVLRRLKLDGVTVHGFRSSFRDWAAMKRHLRASLPRQHWHTSSATTPSRPTAAATRWKSAAPSWMHGPHSARPRRPRPANPAKVPGLAQARLAE
jgi:integrase